MARRAQPRADTAIPLDMLTPLRLCAARNSRLAARRITEHYEKHLAPLGLTISQFGLLAQIAAAPGGVEPGEIARRMNLDASTLSRNLRGLERAALAVIASDADDHRRRRVTLTAAGADTLRRALPLWTEAQAKLAAVLDPAAMRALAKATELLAVD